MWHTQSADTVLEELSAVPERGLSGAEVARRLESYGPNTLTEKKPTPLFVRFLQQLNDVLIYILVAAAGFSFFLKEFSDGIIILFVVFINGIVGVIQEAKAEKALESLKKMTSPKALVRRDGEVREIETAAIVPGDIILLEAGRVVPCDIRLIESADLKAEESALTGESVPSEKNADEISESGSTPLGDRKNMLFMSTIVTFGRGTGVAVGTGMNTEIGKIATMLEEGEEEKTPLQKKLEKFGKVIGFIILALCAVMFGVSMLKQYLAAGHIPRSHLFELFLTAVSLAVAAIPEGLPAIVTIVLAIGVQRMSKRNAIVRRLPAVETLGSVSVVCSDKTGTLTRNRMTVTDVYTDGTRESIENAGGGSAELLLEAMVLCNDATWSKESQTGDPTEVALVAAGSLRGSDKSGLEKKYPRVGEKPFDSERKMMSTVHEYGGGCRVYTKGAADNLVDICTYLYERGSVVPLTPEKKDEILGITREMSGQALRVLGAAYRELDKAPEDNGGLERDMVFIGCVGMIDPPRLEVKDSVAENRNAGIRTVMITGDHRITALAIARELGIADSEEQTLTGRDIDELNEEHLKEKVLSVNVFARVSPEHKVRIVDALQSNGNIVSMTGDGVNDAPSLKSADIGVAMGITGTDVAKGASDMVLTDDNFSTIVAAVGEGRNIYTNIKKSITFLLSCNAGEIVAIFTAILFGWATPLLPIHILWVNLITDTFPALSLGMDPGDPDVMSYPPRDPGESLFAGGAGVNIILNGFLVGILTLGVFWVGRLLYPGELVYARTMAFAVLSFSQLFHAFNLRHGRKSLFQLGIFSNFYLVLALLTGIVLQFLIITVPPFAQVFKVTPLSPRLWLIVFGFSVMPLVLNEIVKLFRMIFRRHGNDSAPAG